MAIRVCQTRMKYLLKKRLHKSVLTRMTHISVAEPYGFFFLFILMKDTRIVVWADMSESNPYN